MELTIDVSEKVVERAAELGLPVSTFVSQLLDQTVDEPSCKTGSVIELFAMPEGSDPDFDPPQLKGPLYHPADLS